MRSNDLEQGTIFWSLCLKKFQQRRVNRFYFFGQDPAESTFTCFVKDGG